MLSSANIYLMSFQIETFIYLSIFFNQPAFICRWHRGVCWGHWQQSIAEKTEAQTSSASIPMYLIKQVHGDRGSPIDLELHKMLCSCL